MLRRELDKNEALINYQDIVFGKVLGSGGYGEVYHGTWRHSDVAIKKLLIKHIADESAQEFEAESQIMARLRFPNIVQFYGYAIEPERCIVMEYCPNGSLFAVLHNKQPLEWTVRIKIALGAAKGLAFLHEEKILHRDIKSLNILLTEHFEAKLTDFGLSKLKTESRSKSSAHKSGNGAVGTTAWMAPELFNRRAVVFSEKSDVYSLGVTFWELTSRKIPFASAPSPDVIPMWVKEGEREEIPADCPPAFGSLIQQCWAGEPSARPDTNTIIIQLKQTLEMFAPPKTSNAPSPNPSSPSPASSGPQYLSNLVSEDVPKPLVFSPPYTIDPKELTLEHELDASGITVVYKGTYRYNDVAVKQFKDFNDLITFEFESELQVMTHPNIEHSPNIIRFYGYSLTPIRCIVTEYMPNGTLFSVLHSNKPLDWSIRIKIAIDATSGLAFLHQENILHGDIKSLHVLLDKNLRAKLTGFALSKIKSKSTSEMTGGALQWMAPELFGRNILFTQKSDIYSLGVTFWELASRKMPFSYLSPPEIFRWVEVGEREKIPTDCPSTFGALIQQCWDGDQIKRPNSKAIITQLKKSLEAFNKPSSNPLSTPASSGPQYLSSNSVFEDAPKPLVFSPLQPKQPAHINTPRPQSVSLIKQASPQEVSVFVRLVAEGEQDQAEALLQKDATLALLSSDVTDLSGRTFKGITGFQYAVWALDWHMWTMIRKYLPDNQAEEQIKAMESGSWVSQHRKSGDWLIQKLLDSLQKYIDLFEQSKFYALRTQWQGKVGRAQRLLLVHVINEYCHPTRSFEPCPDFTKSEPLPRTRKINRGEWFTDGEGCGIYRGKESVCGTDINGCPDQRKDYKACHTLLVIRTQQRNQMIAELSSTNRYAYK